ncbi:MAG: hydroxymethylbilane synthase [Dehalococcoidia bacterium]
MNDSPHRRIIRIGTRGSRLAMQQTNAVIEALRAIAPNTEFHVEQVKSTGDQQAEAPLASLGTGVFTKAIEDALLEGRIDLAVHSLKDLPVDAPKGLKVLAVLPREDPRDALINRWGKGLLELPEGARVGTSSPRRAAQLRYGRKDIVVLPIRGNVETRLAKGHGDDYDGVVLAAAGLRRLGLDAQVTEYLSPHVCTPAPGQAALAAEVRTEDADLLALLRRIVHPPTAASVEAERSLLRAAGAGCNVPIGAYAHIENGKLNLFATATPEDGSASFRVQVSGSPEDPEIAGKAAYMELLEQGAGPVLREQR